MILWFTLLSAGFAADSAGELWAGQQITDAVRKVPVLGPIHTRTTVTTLATVVHDADGARVFIDRPCRITIDNDHGVKLHFDPAAVRSMPPVTFKFLPTETGFSAGPWHGGWGTADVDSDGNDGIAVRVEAPMCGGTLHIASNTESRATAVTSNAGLTGEIRVTIQREIVKASNPCLGLVDRHQTENVSGNFAWVPVPAGSTCESLETAGWPAVATPPADAP